MEDYGYIDDHTYNNFVIQIFEADFDEITDFDIDQEDGRVITSLLRLN